jgi:outer membrane murein-binding lipoprotein Lpp
MPGPTAWPSERSDTAKALASAVKALASAVKALASAVKALASAVKALASAAKAPAAAVKPEATRRSSRFRLGRLWARLPLAHKRELAGAGQKTRHKFHSLRRIPQDRSDTR